jgi:hypothetical protein
VYIVVTGIMSIRPITKDVAMMRRFLDSAGDASKDAIHNPATAINTNKAKIKASHLRVRRSSNAGKPNAVAGKAPRNI